MSERLPEANRLQSLGSSRLRGVLKDKRLVSGDHNVWVSSAALVSSGQSVGFFVSERNKCSVSGSLWDGIRDRNQLKDFAAISRSLVRDFGWSKESFQSNVIITCEDEFFFFSLVPEVLNIVLLCCSQ